MAIILMKMVTWTVSVRLEPHIYTFHTQRYEDS